MNAVLEARGNPRRAAGHAVPMHHRSRGEAMSRKTRIQKIAAVAAVLGFGTVVAQSPLFNRAARLSPDPLPVLLPSAVVFGAPLAGLSASDLENFVDGLEDFSSVDTAASGLGPIFNNVSCVACQSVPAPGGGSAILETRFGRLQNGHFDALAESGGSLLQQSAISPECQETVPPEANVIAQRMTTPLFGLGLIEAIPDQAILRNAQGRQPDNVTGRASLVQDVATGAQRVDRFGWKAQQATLLAFAGDAYLNEIGITNRVCCRSRSMCARPAGGLMCASVLTRFPLRG
jgi:Di-haem oxidoreductase, putative peroxidase